MIYKARELMQTKKAVLIQTLPNRLTVEFEDGVIIETTKRKVIYSRFFWKLHSFYPQTPILSTHFVEYVLKGKPLHAGTHTDLLSIISECVYRTYNLNTPEQKREVRKLIYEITNDISNEVTKYAEPNVGSIDILDFIEVVEHPSIKEAVNKADHRHSSIYAIYETVSGVINNDPSLQNNKLVKAIKSKMVNSNQINQCVAVRGYPTEVNGDILPTPVLSNFTRGLFKLYDFVAESRSAAKSLYFAEQPLQDTEYFARRLQLLNMTVERIAYTDCGSTKYLEWRVNPPVVSETGTTTYPGDLEYLKGKNYLDETTGKLLTITGDEKHLYGTVIKMRSVLYCNHHKATEVCAVCFGELSHNVSEYANLGHLVSAVMTKQSSQSVLSNKHLDGSSISVPITLTESLAKYFHLTDKKNAYVLNKDLKEQKIRIIVSRDEAMGLIDINNVDDVNNINPTRITSIDTISICHQTAKGLEICNPIILSQNNRNAVMTIDFLKFAKYHSWSLDSRNNYCFDLQDWDFSKPIFMLPEKEYSYSDHSKQIASKIESNLSELTDRRKPESVVYTLQELFTLINSKLNVNIAALEVIVYTNMVDKPGSYGLARNSEEATLDVAEQVIRNRSLGAVYAYQEVHNIVVSPKSFFKANRPDSVLDVFIAPREVIEQYPDT